MIRVFRHYIPKALVILGGVEFVILFFLPQLGTNAIYGGLPQSAPLISISQAALFAIVVAVAMSSLGLYHRIFLCHQSTMMFRVALCITVGLSIMWLMQQFSPSIGTHGWVAVFAAVSAFIGIVCGRLLLLPWINHQRWKRRVLVFGAGESAARIHKLSSQELSGIDVVGYVPWGQGLVSVPQRYLLPANVEIRHLIRVLDADEIVVAVDERRQAFPAGDLLACKMSGIEVRDLVDFLERQTGKIEIKTLYPSNVIFADGYVQSVLRPVGKRIFDILISTLIFLVSWPVMVIAALAIWVDSGFKGPILYKQIRVGARDKKFHILKFRSMVPNAEGDGVQWAKENDPRVTRVGVWIRKTRIDELPQLFNVFVGNMSFVGPRPERPEFVSQLSTVIPFYDLRHSIKPGITGWAQINFQYGASEEDAKNKLYYDLYYIKNYSVLLDIMILLQTVRVILWQEGSR